MSALSIQLLLFYMFDKPLLEQGNFYTKLLKMTIVKAKRGYKDTSRQLVVAFKKWHPVSNLARKLQQMGQCTHLIVDSVRHRRRLFANKYIVLAFYNNSRKKRSFHLVVSTQTDLTVFLLTPSLSQLSSSLSPSNSMWWAPIDSSAGTTMRDKEGRLPQHVKGQHLLWAQASAHCVNKTGRRINLVDRIYWLS